MDNLYIDIVDTLILLLLVTWSYMDRCNIYFKKPKKKRIPKPKKMLKRVA